MEEIYETPKNIVTKQLIINKHMSSRLIPITADEKLIDEIQQALNRLEVLEKKELEHPRSITITFTNLKDATDYINIIFKSYEYIEYSKIARIITTNTNKDLQELYRVLITMRSDENEND